METLETYRQIVQQLLTTYANSGGDDRVEAQTIFDTEWDHYQLIYVGWHRQRRVFGPVLHLDIKDSKIWIQWNGTETDIAAELEEQGVPKDNIVLGFHTPVMRKYTEYAVS
ncbi:XisI protein [Acaryochloris sp. IP29b_bin.137]|uniref:XisI protein n=1 Tax=Acaryochloris sp. IP29b_bin.137 TaxID=2969217 RepID=UPI002635B369|nr:XisI protein [Acaryochloris sp. IP29b_bin.137]